MIDISEKELQRRIAEYMQKWFSVETEVWSDDHKKRIDLVMIHKSDTVRIFPIGIEIKQDAKKTGSSLGQWIQQAHVYTEKKFVNYGKVMVITYPQVSGQCLDEGELMSKHDIWDHSFLGCHHNVNTFLGQFHIGELQKYKYRDQKTYLRITYNSKLVWDGRTDEFKEQNYLFGWK